MPVEVKESITEAGRAPEAAANTQAVEDKKEVEAQLLKEVKPAPVSAESKTVEDKPATAPKTETPANGVENGAKAVEARPASAAPKERPVSQAGTEQRKKKNRLSSIFSKLRHKISDKK